MELIRPMEPVLTEQIFEHPDYLYQVKWDGVRILARIEGSGPEEVVLWNRKGRLKSRLYPDICQALADLQMPTGTILDGEMVSLGAKGTPSFRQVLKRDLSKHPRLEVPVVYMVFDCIFVGDASQAQTPLEARQRQLDQFIPGDGLVQLVRSFDRGIPLFEQMASLGMEGVVAKLRGSLYRIGQKHPAWKKIKCWRQMEVPVLGVQTKDGRPSSLLLGPPESEAGQGTTANETVGHASSGLTRHDWQLILAHLDARPTHGVARPTTAISVTVRFLEWTDDGKIRSPVIQSVHVT